MFVVFVVYADPGCINDASEKKILIKTLKILSYLITGCSEVELANYEGEDILILLQILIATGDKNSKEDIGEIKRHELMKSVVDSSNNLNLNEFRIAEEMALEEQRINLSYTGQGGKNILSTASNSAVTVESIRERFIKSNFFVDYVEYKN